MLVVLLFLVVALLAILFVYIKIEYFTMHGPLPGQAPHFLFGNLLQTGILSGKSPVIAFLQLQAKYGDVFQFWMGPMRMILVCDIQDVQHVFSHRQIYDQGDVCLQKHGLFFNDAVICNIGAKYKRHASLTLPLFRRGKVLSNLDLMIDCTDKLLDQWRSNVDNPNHIHLDIVNQSKNLLLSIFGFVAFDYDLETLDPSDTIKTNKLNQALRDFLDAFLAGFHMPTFMTKLYLIISPRYRQALSIIHEYLNRMIEQEQSKTPEAIAERKRSSLIASLVGSLQKDEMSEAAKPEEEKRGLSRTEVVDEMLLFLVAGYETTSTALAWFIHLISKNPRVQAKIKAELGDNRQHRLSIEQLDSLVYLDYVLQEVLRFTPPANGSVRTLTADDRLPESGAQLYKGDQVFIPFYNLARDKRYWKIDPDLFYPERFDGGDKDHHAYASIPFGGGHRQCIGQDLARLELKAITARLMQQVTFGDGGPELNAGGHDQKLTLVPKHVGVTITFD